VAGTYSGTHVRNYKIKQLSPLFFVILWDIDLIFGMWVYNDKLQIKFTFRSNDFWSSYGPWTLKFCQIFSCHHFFLLCLEILTWFLVWVYNHKLQINFEICSGWMIFGFLANLQPLGFEIWPNIYLSPLYFTMIWDIDLIFGMRVYNHKLQINFEIHLLFLAYYWGN
jgi:hypothetical protein